MPIENPFTVGEPVPDCIEVEFYYSDWFCQDDFLFYIQRDRPVSDQTESNRLFELYKQFLNNDRNDQNTASN